MDTIACCLGIPSAGWLGKIVALKYFLSLIVAVPAVSALALYFNFLLFIVELVLLRDLKNTVGLKYGSPVNVG